MEDPTMSLRVLKTSVTMLLLLMLLDAVSAKVAVAPVYALLEQLGKLATNDVREHVAVEETELYDVYAKAN